MNKLFVYESLSDYIKPKSKEEIRKSLGNLSPQEKLEVACEHGLLWLVQETLDEGTDPSENNNLAIRSASYFGYTDIVKLLLADPRVDPSSNNNFAFDWALTYRYINVAKLLFNDKRVRELITNRQLEDYERQINNLKESLSDYVKPKSEEQIRKSLGKLTINEKLKYACKYGIPWLLKDVFDNKYYDFKNAYTDDTLDLLELIFGDSHDLETYIYLIQSLPNLIIDISDIRFACMWDQNIDIIKYMVETQKFGFIINKDSVLVEGPVKWNCPIIVKYLLTCPEINFTKKYNYAFKQAISWRALKSAKVLYSDPKIYKKLSKEDKEEYRRFLFINSNNRASDIDESLSDYVKPKSKEEIEKLTKNLSLQKKFDLGCENNFIELVQEAIDEGVDPSDYDNWAIRYVSKKGYIDIVKLLLKDPRVDPTSKKNESMLWASVYHHYELMKLLLSDERIRNSMSSHELKRHVNRLAANESLGDYVKPKSEKEITDIADTLSSHELLLHAAKSGLFHYVKIATNKIFYDEYNNKNSYDKLSNHHFIFERALIWTIARGYNEISEYFLTVIANINPSYSDNLALILAVATNNFNIVKLLLSFPIVDPTAINNEVIKTAEKGGFLNIIKLLINDERVLKSLTPEEIYKYKHMVRQNNFKYYDK